MKDVRDELVKLVYKTVFICIAVFIIAVFVKDYYLNYLFGLLFYPLNKYIKFVLTFFICFWPFISAIMILLRATWFIIKNIKNVCNNNRMIIIIQTERHRYCTRNPYNNDWDTIPQNFIANLVFYSINNPNCNKT